MKQILLLACMLGTGRLTLAVEATWAEDVVITVAAGGSGQFTQIQPAIMSVPDGRPERPVVIRIKPGVYKERLYIQRETLLPSCRRRSSHHDPDLRPAYQSG